MTTIIGVKTSAGSKEGVVLGSDTQLNIEDERGQLSEKSQIRKIIYGQTWMMADAGIADRDFYKFQQSLLRPKRYGTTEEEVSRMFQEAVDNYERDRKSGKFGGLHFSRVTYINAEARRKDTKLEDLHEFLIAVATPTSVGMWKVDEFGNLKQAPEDRQFEYMSIGSGSTEAEKYIEEVLDGRMDSGPMDIAGAIRTVKEALRHAEKDVNTGGYKDIAVLTSQGVVSYGKLIEEKLRAAEDAVFEEIVGKWKEL